MPRVSLVGDHGGLEDYATLTLWWAAESGVDYGGQIEAQCLGNVGTSVNFIGNPPNGAVITTSGVEYDGSNQASLANVTGNVGINGSNITFSNMLVSGVTSPLGDNCQLTKCRLLSGVSYNSIGTTGKLISFCVISKAIGFVIAYGAGDQGDIENCLIFGTTGTGVITGGGGGQNLKNNFSFNNGSNDYQGATDSFVTNASQDNTGSTGLTGYTSAELVDFAGDDFRTKATSDLADAGTGGSFIGAFLEPGGSTGVIGDIDFTTPRPIFSVSGTASLPQPIASISFDISKPVFNVSGEATLPQPTASIDFSIDKPVLSANGSASLPQPSCSVDFTIGKPVFNVNGSTTLPFPVATIAFDIEKPVFSGSGSATQPNPSGNIDFAIGKPLFSVEGGASLPQPSSSISFDIGKPLFTATGSASIPYPIGEIEFNIQPITFSAIGSATLPNATGNIEFDITPIEFSGNGSVTLPQPNANIEFSIQPLTFVGTGGVSVPYPVGNIDFNISSIGFEASGSVTLPQPIANVEFNIKPIEFTITGYVSGFNIPLGDILEIKTGSNLLLLPSATNIITI